MEKGIFDKDIGASVALTASAIPEGVAQGADGLPAGWTLMKQGPLKVFKDGIEINGHLSAEAVDAIVSFHQAKGEKIPIDSEHMLSLVAEKLGLEEADLIAKTGSRTLAMGFANLIKDADGNIALSDVEWLQPEGAGLMKSKVFRYCSPVLRGLRADKGGLRITSVSMTNNPAIAGMDAIAATADSPEQAASLKSELAKAKGILCLAADAPAEAFHGVLSGLLEAQKESASLKKELSELKLSAESAKKEELLKQGLAEGKISNGLLPFWKGQGVAALTEYLRVAAPSVPLEGLPKALQDSNGSLAASAESLKIWKVQGLSDEQIKALTKGN